MNHSCRTGSLTREGMLHGETNQMRLPSIFIIIAHTSTGLIWDLTMQEVFMILSGWIDLDMDTVLDGTTGDTAMDTIIHIDGIRALAGIIGE